MGLKFYVEFGVDGRRFWEKRDIKVFMEGIIGDIEVGVCNFA